MFEKLAQELRDAREQLQFTLEQLARQIKIDIKFLQKIEKGDLSFLPELYIRAYLRDYAEAVHLDVQIIMKKYDLAKEGRGYDEIKQFEEPEKPVQSSVLPPDATKNSSIPAAAPKRIVMDNFDSEPPKSRQSILDLFGPHTKIIALGVGLFLILIGAGYYFFLRDTTPEIIVDQPFEQTVEEQKRFEEPVQQQITTSPNDSLKLSVEVVDTCWMQMVIDSTIIDENFYTTTTSFIKKAANSIKLTVGNSAGINLRLNDQAFEFTKQKKRSAKFVITREGIRQVNVSQ